MKKIKATIRINHESENTYFFDIFIDSLVSWNESYYPYRSHRAAKAGAVTFCKRLNLDYKFEE